MLETCYVFSPKQLFHMAPICVYVVHLNTYAALQFKLQSYHIHLTGGAELFDLGHLLAHLIDGHLDGAEISVVLVHHCYSFLYVGETVCGWGSATQ